MEQKSLAKWLKFVILGVGLCGLFVYLYMIPSFGTSMVEQYPEFSGAFWPWLIFLWITAIPCYAVLFFGWRIAGNIGRDRSFSVENSNYLKYVSWMAAIDSLFFFVGNVVLLFMNMNHPGILLISLIITFAGVTVTVAAAVLSHLVQKAARLQEQSDLTI